MSEENNKHQSSIPLDHEYVELPIPHRWEMSDDEMIKKSQEFYELMKKRHTVREYSERAVPREVIENCIKAAGLAPSGANPQPWHFAVIENPDHKQKIREAAEEKKKHSTPDAPAMNGSARLSQLVRTKANLILPLPRGLLLYLPSAPVLTAMAANLKIITLMKALASPQVF